MPSCLCACYVVAQVVQSVHGHAFASMPVVARSGVAKERKVFMDLMRNEIDRVNTVLSKSGQGEPTCLWPGQAYMHLLLSLSCHMVQCLLTSCAPAKFHVLACHQHSVIARCCTTYF